MDGVHAMVLAAAYAIVIYAPNTSHQKFIIPALLDALIQLPTSFSALQRLTVLLVILESRPRSRSLPAREAQARHWSR